MPRRAALQYVHAQKRLRALNAEAFGVPKPQALMRSGGVRRGRGAYEGARSDVRELRHWTPGTGSPATDTIPDLPELRARTRDLDRNAPIATGIIETNLDHVVGTGLFPVPAPDHEALGISEERAREFGKAAMRIYHAAMNTTRLHIGDRMTGLQQQWALLRSVLAGGDSFAIRRFKERPGDLLGLKIEYVEAERVTNPNDGMDTEWLQDGIEFDEDRRATRVWVRSQHPGEALYYAVPTWRGVPVYGAETGERQVLHCLEQRRLDQPRGVPLLAPVIKPLKQTDEILGNELMAALVQSLFTVFIKSQLGDDDGPELQDLLGSSQHLGPKLDRQELRLGKGLIARLNPGEEIQLASTNRPNAQLDPFINSVLTMTGAGVGMPHELLVKRFQSSYSAARAAMLQAWRAFDRRQTWLVETALQSLWEWILDEAVLRGYLEAPGFHDDPYVRQAWCRAEWRGPTREQLDELKEVLAAERRVAAGFSTVAHETSGLTGLDPDQVHAQRVIEVQRRVEAGLEAPVAAAPATPTTPTRPRDFTRVSPDTLDDEGGDGPVESHVQEALFAPR